MQTAPQSRNCANPVNSATGDDLLAETLIAIESGFRLEDYLAARAAGATHAEILAAECEGIYRWGYVVARKSGLTHRQVVRLNYRHWTPLVQAQVVRDGVTPSELNDVLDRNVNLQAYRSARQRGLTHFSAIGSAYGANS